MENQVDKYILLHNTVYTNYTGNDEVEIAKIIDSETNDDVLYINYNKSLYREAGYHFTANICFDDNNNEFLTVHTDDFHRECLFNQPKVFLTLALHEYGHYINGDLYEKKGVTNESIKDERLRCVLEGRVMEQELKADAFAVKYVGKNTFMRTMDYLIKRRRERADNAMDLAIKEFELRKKAVRSLK